MRLLGPYMFVFVGVLIGIIATRLFKNPMRIAPNVILGIAGSFFGLWLRDITDLTLGGNLRGALIAATLGAIVFTGVVNLVLDSQQSGTD